MGLSLLIRHLSTKNFHLTNRSTAFPLVLFHLKPFSSLQTSTAASSNSAAKPSSLSARLSFVFDQIDAIEKERSSERSEKDQTLQRIRTWRESKRAPKEEASAASASAGELNCGAIESTQPSLADYETKREEKSEKGLAGKLEVELIHPWSEWIELMERLVQQNYFDRRSKEEDKMVEDLDFKLSEAAEEGLDLTRDWNTVQTAILNFGLDRFDILRSLSRQDIQILVGYGCPSANKKVTFSGKLLRKHAHLDEGDVCSSCSLRSSCEKAYLLTNKEDEAMTVDLMRVLLTYGFDPVDGSVTNKSLLKLKSVKTVVRKLLHEVVMLSAIPRDPNLSPPVIKKPPPKVKQPPPPPKKWVGRHGIEMKKGDWLCPKCNFMNFAKNNVCLQCDAKRPKSQLLPGEWECPQCNFLNYRRNVVCFHCERKRPPDEFTENQMRESQQVLRTRPGKISKRADISNAWNFNFEDGESDGAAVAACEYADSQKLDEDFPLDRHVEGDKLAGMHEREYSKHAPKKTRIGFDDFDDDDDNLDSYELDTPNNNKVQKDSSIDFSELESDSDSEDIEGIHNTWPACGSPSSSTNNKPSKPMRRRAAFSATEDDELDMDSDGELPIRPSRKSSNFGSRQRGGGRGAADLGSDDDLGLSSGTEDIVDADFRSWTKKGNFSGKSGLGSDDDDPSSNGSWSRGNRSGRNRNSSRGPGNRGNAFEDNFSRSNRGSQSNGRGRGDDYGRRVSARENNEQNFRNLGQRGTNNQQRRTSNNFGNHSDSFSEDDRYRRPRVNVR